MMYRVFLEEMDAATGHYRIRPGEINNTYHTTPDYVHSLEEQLQKIGINSGWQIDTELVDDHYIILSGSNNKAVVHTLEEAVEKSYEVAKKAALDLRDRLSKQEQKKYIFIDLTSKGDKEVAKKLATIIEEEFVPYVSPRACDYESI